jgi:hypothetical protein
MDFTSHHSFLRLRKVKKINLKLRHTKKTQPSIQYKDLKWKTNPNLFLDSAVEYVSFMLFFESTFLDL